MANPTAFHARNRVFARLPKDEQLKVGTFLKPIDLPLRFKLYDAAAPIDYVYFPTSGIASSVAYVGDGSAIEVSTVGNEGVVGLPALFGPAKSPNEVFMQVAGDGVRISATVLRKEAGVGSALYALLAKYLSAYLYQVSQAVACNGLHTVRQRCCRWILMTHDRVQADELELTHEFLGVMLGVRRASVSEVLQPLQERGLVRSARGVISVLDRAGLEGESCECYRLVANEYTRLMK